MWLGSIEAQDISWAREPNDAITGEEFASFKIPEQADQAESHIVFVTMNLGNGIGIDLQRAPDDTIGHGIQRGQGLVDLTTQVFHA
jgi:hypothetical protein